MEPQLSFHVSLQWRFGSGPSVHRRCPVQAIIWSAGIMTVCFQLGMSNAVAMVNVLESVEGTIFGSGGSNSQAALDSPIGQPLSAEAATACKPPVSSLPDRGFSCGLFDFICCDQAKRSRLDAVLLSRVQSNP